MNPALLVQVLIVILPKLRDYFTKNAGVNSVSGGFLGWLLGVASVAFSDQATTDQFINWLQNNYEWGFYVAGAFAALRTFIFFVKGGAPKLVAEAKKQAE